MKKWWRWHALLALWWMLVFLVQRCLFLGFAVRKLKDIAWTEIMQCQAQGLFMDISSLGYMLLVTSLLTIPLLFSEVKWMRRTIVPLTLVLLTFTAIITAADVGLFNAWGAKLDRKALGYLAFPEEAAASISFRWLALLIGVVVAQVVVLGWLLLRIDHRREFNTGGRSARIAAAVALPVLSLIAARGGPQDDPINKSWAYFSRHPVLNLAALNGFWNAMEIAVQPAQVLTNPYVSMDDAEAERIFKAAHPKGPSSSPSILKTRRPNILVIMLESWTADVIEPLGGDSGVTPAFTQLARDGVLFDHYYSTGFRTEQGLCALMSAFPSQPTTTIIRNFGKFDRLPSIVRVLDTAGYSSTYWYAGNVEFANTRAYLTSMGFDVIHSERSFEAKKRTDWGAFDEELFAFHLKNVHTSAQPFLHVIMTSTSHEPFDAPVAKVFAGRSEPQLYRNTVHYTDSCLGAFLQDARELDWYDSTLVIVVADHGHYLPHNTNMYSAARHRIPFLLTGGALREELRGTVDHTPGSHVDLAATLLAQLGLPRDRFEWSNDLFDPHVPHMARWSFNEGFGIADSVQTLVFDETADRVIELRDSARTTDADRLLVQGKAGVQVLLDRYIRFNQ